MRTRWRAYSAPRVDSQTLACPAISTAPAASRAMPMSLAASTTPNNRTGGGRDQGHHGRGLSAEQALEHPSPVEGENGQGVEHAQRQAHTGGNQQHVRIHGRTGPGGQSCPHDAHDGPAASQKSSCQRERGVLRVITAPVTLAVIETTRPPVRAIAARCPARAQRRPGAAAANSDTSRTKYSAASSSTPPALRCSFLMIGRTPDCNIPRRK